MNSYAKLGCLILVMGSLTACGTLTGLGTDNTPPPSPLVAYTPGLTPTTLWSSSPTSGTHKMVVNLVPTLAGNTVLTADQVGTVAANNAANGRLYWQTPLNTPLTAGPSSNGSVVVVGTSQGELYALQLSNGHILWHTVLPNQILGVPDISANAVAVETVDGKLLLLNANTGQIQWSYDHGAPAMILRGGSSPQITRNSVIAGYADGKISSYSLADGKLNWEHMLSEPSGATDIEQMVDIVVNPIVADGVIYTANYQGNIAALDASSGNVIWQHPLSSFTGLALNNQYLFASDANGYVWAFDKSTGDVLWRQTLLANRIISAPAIQGNTVVVADGEGFIHWLSQQDGRFVARISSSSAPISMAPAVNGNVIYVLNNAGALTAYVVR